MTKFELDFKESALKEWRSLDPSARERLKKKLERRLENPHVQAEALSGELAGCYKIKDNRSGIRLVYDVIENDVVVLVLSVGPRSHSRAYSAAAFRRA